MNIPIPENYVDNDDELDPSRVLASWCEAITGLFMHYDMLHTHLVDQSTCDAYRGQCPVYQLVQLAKTMQDELENLQRDLDQLPELNQSTSQPSVKRLAAHTVILNRLNQQAIINLRLAEMPAC